MHMTRKQFLSIGLAGQAPSLAAAVRWAGSAAAGRKPRNVLLLMSDQHRPGALGIAGDPYARTPHLDHLARSGVRFSSAYCTNPVCVPSRMSILTGLYAHNHGAVGNEVPLPFRVRTMAHAFDAAGYMTALVGKMHFVDAQTHGFAYRLDFNDWLQFLGPKAKLYADELGQANSGSGLPQIPALWSGYGDPWRGARKPDGREGPVQTGGVSKMDERDHFDSFVADESVRFLREHGREQPFLLISSFLKPHDPFMPAERFARMYQPEDMRLPDSWNPATRHAATPELRDPRLARLRMAMYYACLAQMDDCAGRVLRALDESGLAGDTIVLYISDHGEMLGEHGLWAKFVFYEPSVGVPLLIRVPGVTPADARCATPVSLTQILPTLTELCGVPTPRGLDGASLVQDLRAPGTPRETTVFSEYHNGRPDAQYMIRKGGFKLNLYANRGAELFDLLSDPHEMNNLAEAPESRAKVRELKQALFAWYRPPEAGFSRELL